MDIQVDHNKLLKKIAKERLTPHGIFQKGQSRTFINDKGWYLILIEFQPSSESKGSYLNVGVDLNFYPREHFVFGYGYREKGLGNFVNELQFEKFVNELCDVAIKRSEDIKQKFVDIFAAIKTLEKQKHIAAWDLFDIAFLYALTANIKGAETRFKKILKEKCHNDFEFEFERKAVVEQLLISLESPTTLLERQKEIIAEARNLKKLPDFSLADMHKKIIDRNKKSVGESFYSFFERLKF